RAAACAREAARARRPARNRALRARSRLLAHEPGGMALVPCEHMFAWQSNALARGSPPLLRRPAAGIELLRERHRPRVTAARPGREQQQEARWACGAHLVPLLRGQLDEHPDAAACALPGGVHLDLAVEHDEPGALVHLVL